jgi:hypothetical protein
MNEHMEAATRDWMSFLPRQLDISRISVPTPAAYGLSSPSTVQPTRAKKTPLSRYTYIGILLGVGASHLQRDFDVA